MCKCHIVRRRNISYISCCVLNIIPCRRNYIYTADICNRVRQICICILTCHLMPAHIYFSIHSKIGIFLFLKWSLKIFCLSRCYRILLNISYIAIHCSNLGPVFQFFQKDQCIPRLHICQDRRLDSTLITDTCIFFSCRCLHSGKSVLDCNSVRIFIYIGIQVCKFLHETKTQINCSILQPYIAFSALCCRIILQFRRCRIKYLLVSTIPVISLIQICIYHIKWKIYLISWHQCAFFHDFSSQNNCHFPISGLSIIFCKIHSFFCRNIFLNKMHSQPHNCQH